MLLARAILKAHSRKICLSLVYLQATQIGQRLTANIIKPVKQLPRIYNNKLNFSPSLGFLSSPTLPMTHLASCLTLTGRSWTCGRNVSTAPTGIVTPMHAYWCLYSWRRVVSATAGAGARWTDLPCTEWRADRTDCTPKWVTICTRSLAVMNASATVVEPDGCWKTIVLSRDSQNVVDSVIDGKSSLSLL